MLAAAVALAKERDDGGERLRRLGVKYNVARTEYEGAVERATALEEQLYSAQAEVGGRERGREGKSAHSIFPACTGCPASGSISCPSPCMP